VGKYIDHRDAYKSIYESLDHAGFAHSARVLVKRIEAEELEEQEPELLLGGVDGILVPGGFGMRGIEGKVRAVRYARENNIPYFGICLGMQCAAIEFARNVLGLERAHTAEMDEGTPDPVIHLMADQADVHAKGGTMRLGAMPCRLARGSRASELYGAELVHERHRHRFEFNNAYRERFEAAGLHASGINPDRDLVEILELEEHPFFVGVQFHPEFKSQPLHPHPIFRGFVAAALERARNGGAAPRVEKSLA
ncbi:MAG TPA: CTP synthase, partial [Planctomycetota bacterium]|nr:CTP synthase [Planctomycetota bacterium]